MTTAEYQQRFADWIKKHYLPGSCEFCDHEHDGYHDYTSHLIEAHPDDFLNFKEWAGLK